MTAYRSVATSLLALAGLALGPAPSFSQSITTGSVAGVVVGADGQPMSAAQVQIRPVAGGMARTVESRGARGFHFPDLAAGDYELLAERLGYRPVLLSPLPVRPGRQVHVSITLRQADGAVGAADSVTYGGRALAAGSRPGRSRSFGELELRSLPSREGTVGGLLSADSRSAGGLAVEGLPSGLGGLAIAGLPFTPVTGSGAGAEDGLLTLVAPNRSAAVAELLLGRPDVEWPALAGGLLGTTPPGPGVGSGGELGGVWGGEALSLDEAPAGFVGWRGGASGGRSLAGDSAHAWAFAEVAHREVPVAFWPAAAGGGEELAARGVDVAPLVGVQPGATDRVNLGGTFDWLFAGGRSLGVVALYGQGEADHGTGGLFGRAVPVTADARDLFVAATAAAELAPDIRLRIRASFGQSRRERVARDPVETGLGDAVVGLVGAGAQLNGDPWLPATLERSDFTGQAALDVRGGDHRVKVGAGLQLRSHDRSALHGRTGSYLFGGAADFGARQGAFHGVDGPVADASFSVPELYAFGQDAWRVAPGLDVTTGIRYTHEALPSDDVVPNARWEELTGIDNAALPASANAVTLVAGFDWDVQERHQWLVRGAVAMQAGDVAPELLAEALLHDGRVEATAAVGDVTAPVALGPRLTILSPGFEAPLTTRASFGVSRALGSTTVLHLDAALRRTTNLPARTDLNLAPRPAFRDQYGRPVFGNLTRAGGILHAEPGSNRRFSEFEAVSALASSAMSTWWGVTAALEKRYGHLRGVASYTYSKTEDDWTAAGAAAPLDALPPFPGEDALDDWADGTSDFDVPHRFALAAELSLPFAEAVSVGAFWRMESGRPFTPGFGRAIDANGDGVAGNDPAFIDPDIAGMDALQEEWECLRTGAGRFAERNACRTGARSLLDAWLAVRVPGLGAVTPELRIEALGLDAEGADAYDTALFLLDPAGEVTVDAEAGLIEVPLAVNPRFGTALTPPRELSRLRISLRMVF